MGEEERRLEGRLRRLAEAIGDEGFPGVDPSRWEPGVFAELDYAMHPRVHERRVPTYGAFVGPVVPTPLWEAASNLSVNRRQLSAGSLPKGRRFADGVSTWIVRRGSDRAGWDVHDEPWGAPVQAEDDPDAALLVFDRPAGSERDLVVLAGISGASIVQRNAVGVVRLVAHFGVLRWDSMRWHHEPPTTSWIDLDDGLAPGDHPVLGELLRFAVHDMGARGAGTILVYRPDGSDEHLDLRLPPPPPLRIDRPADLAPLRHVLAQVDGAAVFDEDGVLVQLGARIVPSMVAESAVESFRGMRHTSARLFSYDDPSATVIVVSDDGPVTVWRRGRLLGRSETVPIDDDGD